MIILETLDEMKLPHILIKRIALEKGISPALLAAFVTVESTGNRFAAQYQPHYKHFLQPNYFARKNGITEVTERMWQATSFGLMQIMGSTARELGFVGNLAQLFDAELNLRLGASYILRLKKQYRSETDWISAYNQGQPFRTSNGAYKNQDYVNRVLAAKERASMWL